MTAGSATARANVLAKHDGRQLKKRDADTNAPMPDAAVMPVGNAITIVVVEKT